MDQACEHILPNTMASVIEHFRLDDYEVQACALIDDCDFERDEAGKLLYPRVQSDFHNLLEPSLSVYWTKTHRTAHVVFDNKDVQPYVRDLTVTLPAYQGPPSRPLLKNWIDLNNAVAKLIRNVPFLENFEFKTGRVCDDIINDWNILSPPLQLALRDLTLTSPRIKTISMIGLSNIPPKFLKSFSLLANDHYIGLENISLDKREVHFIEDVLTDDRDVPFSDGKVEIGVRTQDKIRRLILGSCDKSVVIWLINKGITLLNLTNIVDLELRPGSPKELKVMRRLLKLTSPSLEKLHINLDLFLSPSQLDLAKIINLRHFPDLQRLEITSDVLFLPDICVLLESAQESTDLNKIHLCALTQFCSLPHVLELPAWSIACKILANPRFRSLRQVQFEFVQTWTVTADDVLRVIDRVPMEDEEDKRDEDSPDEIIHEEVATCLARKLLTEMIENKAQALLLKGVKVGVKLY